MKRNTKKLLFALGLILPAFAMLCLTIITPLINIIWMSFHDYSLLNIKNIKWNDFKNYTVLFGEKEFWNSFVRTIVYVAVTVAAIALIVRMVSRNQRAVDEATSWLKRIVVTWIVLNTLGFIVAYLQPLIAGGQYTGG